MTTTISIPQDEGVFSPEEAIAFRRAQEATANRAGDEQTDSAVLNAVTSIMAEWTDRMQPLFRRWRATNKMLAGNTLASGGPEDVHSPEIYKAMETLIPRIEEIVVEAHDPWFDMVSRRRKNMKAADAISAMLEWQFTQAKVRHLLQPAIRDTLITQVGTFYVWWDNKESWRNVLTVKREFDEKGRLHRSVKIDRKKVIDYSGPRAQLIDPFDFIIDTKATNAQEAIYVGHRAWLTIDEVRRIGKELGWRNLDKLESSGSQYQTLGPNQYAYGYTSDPTARYPMAGEMATKPDGRPEKVEVVFLYSRMSFDQGETFDDTRMVVAAGKTVLEVRSNPLDGQYRPYATMRIAKTGHHFFSTGTFDNAIRLNQHLDRALQIYTRGSAIAGMPIAFAEEDSDLPDSLYKVRPFTIYKGVGNIRFTQIPDGFLRAMPLMVSMWQRQIEETVGSFRLNMGQDSNGTATEATLSLQEGNRRTRGIVRAVGDGLEQLLDIFYRLNKQFSVEDVEFPVLGKRALDLRKTHLTVGPADFLDDVQFELIGLRNTRNYGLKATGYQAFVNSMTPFMMANPTTVDQPALMHDVARELIGPDEANRIVKIPTPIDQLYSQHEENEVLIAGEEVDVDPDDDDVQHLQDMEFLWQRALDPDDPMPLHVRKGIWQHRLRHMKQMENKQAQEQVRQGRMQQQQTMLPPEAGGQQAQEGGGASPQRGGMSDALTALANDSTPGGQTQNENPGPADSRKYSRSGGSKRTTNQTENSL